MTTNWTSEDDRHVHDMQTRAAKVARVFGFDEQCACAECGAALPEDRFSSFCEPCAERRWKKVAK